MTADTYTAPAPARWPNDAAATRAIALGAGDLNHAIRTHVTELLRKNRNNGALAAQKGLQELVTRGAITPEDGKRLGEVIKLIVDVARKRADPEDAYLRIRTVYHDMALAPDVSPAALAIASVASSSFALEKQSPLKVNPTAGAFGGIIGAVTGAGIGFGIGGPIGGAIGGAIGGVVGAVTGLCGSGET